MRSKCFRGVWDQRNSEEWDFQCFACAEIGARAKKLNRIETFATQARTKLLNQEHNSMSSDREFRMPCISLCFRDYTGNHYTCVD